MLLVDDFLHVFKMDLIISYRMFEIEYIGV